ncbi:MAG: preprotein translocase subunit SecA [bacterium]|nr:preprotein translocase subunit SecA [bacterium]
MFGDANESYLKKLRPLVVEINEKEKDVGSLSDQELKEKTQILKDHLAQGETLQDLLSEAFALAREAAKRTLGQRHFDVQLMGGIALHEGKVAEMKTGEGKTLVATLPAYLNALAGKGVHVVTVNDYLAKRDAVWMGQIYFALGLTTGCITHDASYLYDPLYQGEGSRDKERDMLGSFKVVESYLRPVSRKEAYAADITYGTNNEFGFDYLRDNMAYDLNAVSQRAHSFAIVDEMDSILIDEARTPLIISAPDEESSHWYYDFAKIIPQMDPATDYEIDEKLRAVTLTEQGIDRVEQLLNLKDIYQEKGIKYLHHLEQALRAQALFKRDKDYVVKSGEVIIVDEFTGRMLPGRRYSGGLHQALEAKEGVKVQPESLTLASITFQNYFRMYEKLGGMTGTALTSAEEFHKVYNLDVVSIPTHRPLARQDLPDRVYTTVQGKFTAVVREIKERHAKGQPVLVGTVSIERNERLSKLLEIEGVPHRVLNAKNHEREAETIAQAGKLGSVTIATNMAGRGVDIILGGNPPVEEDALSVREAGGLYVIGTERHEARRIDNQLRGRSGRQGDPGSSQFFISLEDDLMRIFGGERLKSMLDRLHVEEDQPIEAGMVSKAIESAQARVEGANFDIRKHLLDYDDVLSKHRGVIYKKRRALLEMSQSPADGSLRTFLQEITEKFEYSKEDYEKKMQELGPDLMVQAERIVGLRAIDSLWLEHLEGMERMRDSVRLRAYGQQDPLVEYKNEGRKMFQSLLDNIDELIANSLMKLQKVPTQQTPQQRPVSSPTVGRNDPCPCGSGKKYKKCHG